MKEPLRNMFFNHIAQTCDTPPALEIARGDACFLYDFDGKEYIDFISGISVSSLGHNNEKIQKAVIHQMNNHTHVMVYGEYILSSQAKLAAKLTSLLPPSLSSVYFTNSGAEAVEGAMKLAKRFTGRTKFFSMKNAYHGSTQGALSLMGNEFFKQSFRPLLPDIYHIEYNNLLDLGQIDGSTAAVFAEIIQSETGYTQGEIEYLSALQNVCNKNGALLIVDEAQSGLGRTGKMFAFEHTNIVPDVLILAKAIGGGFPLGAFIASNKIMQSLSSNPPLGHITTFGGHPISCAASLAAIEQIEQDGFLDAVSEKEMIIRNSIHKLNPELKISGKGLLLAIHFETEELCQTVIEKCLIKGLIADWFLFAPNCLRIAPPLIMSNELIEKSCSIISESIYCSI